MIELFFWVYTAELERSSGIWDKVSLDDRLATTL